MEKLSGLSDLRALCEMHFSHDLITNFRISGRIKEKVD